jgi:hypothetical protein
MDTQSLWTIIKQTLLEKSGDNIFGSIKRWVAWILLFLVCCIVISSLIPSGSIHIGTWLNVSWHHIKVDMPVLTSLLTAMGTYILTGQALTNVTDTIQHYNEKRFNNSPNSQPNIPM